MSQKQTSQIKVTHFTRKPRPGDFSVERLYADIRQRLQKDMHISVRENWFFSNGIFRRLADALMAVKFIDDVNHITGDTHYLTFFLRRKRTVLTILDCVPLESSFGIKFWIMWFFWYWLPVKRSAQVVVISEATKQQVLRYLNCDPNKVRVIHCSVSEEFFSHEKEFNEDCPRILHIGTGGNKNLERHIAALAKIHCEMVIIGLLSDEQRALLDASKLKYENLSDLSREEIVKEYQRCDLLLFSSLYEGFGLPILEAQATGRPVVTANLWSMPEVAGEGALLVDPYSIKEISEGVLKIIESRDYRNRLIRSGFKNVKRFSLENIASQYARLYRHINQSSLK